MDKDEMPEEQKADKPSPYDATRDVVHRHLSDINDEITDDDIRNAYTGENHPPVVPDPKLAASVKKDIERSKKEDDDDDEDDDDRLPVPPANILSE